MMQPKCVGVPIKVRPKDIFAPTPAALIQDPTSTNKEEQLWPLF